jgi:hypothetical protein
MMRPSQFHTPWPGSQVIPTTLAITWPHGVRSEEENLSVAAQVNGGVS